MSSRHSTRERPFREARVRYSVAALRAPGSGFFRTYTDRTALNGKAIGESWDTTKLADGWVELLQGGETRDVAILNNAAVHCEEGRLTEDTTWDSSAVRLIRNDVYIPNGVTLTITEGTTVKFTEDTRIIVENGGKLQMNGSADAYVQFAMATDDGFAGDTDMRETEIVFPGNAVISSYSSGTVADNGYVASRGLVISSTYPSLTLHGTAVYEDCGTAYLPVTVSESRNTSFYAEWMATDGTATFEEDYSLAFGKLTWGSTSDGTKYIAIPIVKGNLAADDETFTVRLVASGGANIQTTAVTVTIRKMADTGLEGLVHSTTVSAAARLDLRDGFGGLIVRGTMNFSTTEGKVSLDGRQLPSSWNSTTSEDGWHELSQNGQSADICVLNNPEVALEEGRLTQNTTWDSTTVHLVRNNIYVPNGVTLMMTSGAVVKFTEDTRIIVEHGGKVSVQGAEGSPVQFALATDDMFGGDTDCHDGTMDLPTYSLIDCYNTTSGWADNGQFVLRRVMFNTLPTVYIHNSRVMEHEGVVMIPVTVSGTRKAVFAVDWTAADGTAKLNSDYALSSGRVTWTSTDNGTRYIEIPIVSDDVAESQEEFTVMLTASTGTNIATAESTVSIVESAATLPADAEYACDSVETEEGVEVDERTDVFSRLARDVETLRYSTTWAENAVASSVRLTVQLDEDNEVPQTIHATADGETDGTADWETTSLETGRYLLAHEIFDNRGSLLDRLETKFFINRDIIVHEGRLTGDETWDDSAIHVVRANVIVPAGVLLTISDGAIVKFQSGCGIIAKLGSVVECNGVTFTHIADDSVGGDTNLDGNATMPIYDSYNLTGFTPGPDCKLCYIIQTFAGGTIYDTKILQGNTVHHVTGNITIASGGKLIVQPGAVVKMNSGLSITVNNGGILDALGNRAQPIVFTSIKDDEHGGDSNGDGSTTVAEGGDWKYIYVQGQAKLQYCTLMYGAPTNETGIIETSGNGVLEMDCCTVAHAVYDGIWNWGGSITVRNSVIMDVGLGAAPYRGTKNEYTNCVFYENNYIAMYWGHWSGNPVFNNCIFKNMGWDWLDTNGYSQAYNVVKFNHCLFHNDIGYDVQSCVKTGIDGNLYSDPLFENAANGNFTLHGGSPCIDAGDGSVANLPQYDYYGNPRSWSDGHVTPTGIADASGNVPDIGLFEMCGDIDSDLDLIVNSVSGTTSVMTGEMATIRWTVTNIGTASAGGVRRDNIYLVSKDERLGDRRVFVTTATFYSSMASGDVKEYEIKNVKIPPVTPGKWAFAVFVNEERDWFEGRNIGNNYLVSKGYCDITVPTVSCASQGESMMVVSGETAAIQLMDVPAEGAMLVIRGGNGVKATGQFGQLPETIAHGWKAVELNNGTVLLTIPPATVASDVFILLENTGNEDVQVGIDTLTGSFALFDNGVTTASNSGTVTIPLYGIGLTEDMEVYLKQGASSINALSLTAVEQGAVYATFDVTGATGSWTLFASNENGSDSFVALTLIEVLKGPQWWCRLELPSAIRKGRECVGYLVYGNSGDCDLDAPYVKLEGKAGVSLRYDNNWGWSKKLNLLALSSTWPVSKLSPGESRRIPFQFIYNNTDSIAQISYGFTIDSDSPYPWNDITPQLRPSWADDAAWKKMYTILKSRLGNTWGTYLDRLRADADELAKNGVVTSHLDEIWQVEVNEAVAANYVMPTLESSMDIGLDARGLALYVIRSYNTSPMTRNTSGLFGNGWQTNLNLKGETNKQKTQMSFPLPDGDSLFAMKTDDGYWAVQSPNGDIYCRQTAGGFILEKRKAWTMTYDSSLRLKTMEDVYGNKVTYQWNGDLLMKMSHSDGPSLDFVYQNNRLVKITDHHGRSVIYGYSSSNLVSVTDWNGLVTSYGYAQDGALTSATSPDNQTTNYQYDTQVGRLVSIARNGNANITQFIHSGMGRVDIVNPLGESTTIQFGTHGERLYEIDALGNRTTYQYDDQNVLKSIVYANGQVVSYDMNSDSKTESTTDAAGHTTVKQYDTETGLLSRVMDVKGNLVSGFGYDDRYSMVTVEDAVGNCSVAEYDNEGNLVCKTNKNGQAISFEFDDKGRIIKKIWPDKSRVFTFEYDSYGNMTKATDSLLGNTTMVYDAKWNLLKRITYPDGRGYDVTYDEYGRKGKVRTFDGFEQNFIYDTFGYLAQITDEKGALLVGYEHDVIGFVTRRTYGNGTYSCYEYDANSRVVAIKHYDKTNALMESFEYIYDAVGRCVSRKQSTGTDFFTYNAAGQLTRVDYADGTYEAFTYDATGNRMTSDVNGDVRQYTVNSLNQYLKAGNAEFAYDDEGNMLSCTENGGTTHYEYDVENRLVKVTKPDGKVWSCVYNVFGDRVQTNDNGTVTNYLFNDDENSSVMAQYGGNGKIDKRFILNGILALGEMNASGACTYYHEDMGLNNRLFTNAQGKLTARQDYQLFGQLLNESDMVAARGFAGGVGHSLDSTGLVLMRHRYYSPVFGRFIQNDPIGLAGNDVNFYRYCNNNPMTYVDADGNSIILAGIGFVALLGWYGHRAVETGAAVYYATHPNAHYSDRDKFNKIKEQDVRDAVNGKNGWKRLPAWKSSCHDPVNNVKYVNDDGREIVIRKNPGGVCIVNQDPRYRASFNYANPDNGLIEMYWHHILDASASWIPLGNSLDDPSTVFDRKRDYSIIKALWLARKEEDTSAPCNPDLGVDLEDKIPVPGSRDPNEMVGPKGFGNEATERFVTPGEWLSYTINFENKSSATAAAQEVFVDAQLSEHLDWSTFEIGSVLFSNQTEMGLMGKQRGKILVDRQNTNQKVQIEVTMNASTGKVRWYLRSYDPNTTDHWPASVYDGFLPPNDDNHIGEGSLTYRIKVKDDAPHNARIDASAEIIFDTNAMIPTDPTWFNTVYAMAPDDDFEPSLSDGMVIQQLDSLSWKEVAGAAEYDVTLWKVIDGRDVQVASATGLKMGYWDISGYATDDIPGTTYHWQIVARNGLGSRTSDIYSFRLVSEEEEKGCVLLPGWNLIAAQGNLPLAGNNDLFVELQPFMFDRNAKAYVSATLPLVAGTPLWIYSNSRRDVHFNHEDSDIVVGGLTEKAGWHLVGVSGEDYVMIGNVLSGWQWGHGKWQPLEIQDDFATLEAGRGYFVYKEEGDVNIMRLGWIRQNFDNEVFRWADDVDGDGLTNWEEYKLETNPVKMDTDGDGMPDGWEVQNNKNPLDPNDIAPEMTTARYLIVDLSGGPAAESYPTRYSSTGPDLNDDTCRTTELWLRRIPKGRFIMGSPEGEGGGSPEYELQHEVMLTQDFYMGVFECTQRQWELVMGNKPSWYSNETYYAIRPVECIAFNDIRGTSATAGSGWPEYGHRVDDASFLGKLQGKTGLTFDLPMEAQWEYACRAGTMTALNSGKNLIKTLEDTNINEVGRYWFNGGSEYSEDTTPEKGTAIVGSYRPNAWKLYDMHGNVWEWCLDWCDNYRGYKEVDPRGPNTSTHRIVRGGGMYFKAMYCRSAHRNGYEPDFIQADFGFRVACHPSQPKYTISVINGTANFDKAFEGETITITANEPDEGIVFSRWVSDDMEIAEITKASTTFVMPAKSVTMKADYVAKPNVEEVLYLVVDLSGGPDVTSYPVRYSREAPNLNDDKCRTTELWLRRIPAGTFIMGSPEDELGRYSTEIQREVTLTQDYYIGVFECTQRQWELVMGNTPSLYKGDCRPVEFVSYNMIRGTGSQAGEGWPTYGHVVDSTSFMGKLQEKTGLTFDLPTEAQWEYACRAGTTTALNSGKNLTSIYQDAAMGEVGRYYYNNNDGKGGYSQHTKVGSYLPNAWELYDMHGNVWEWCLDWYGTYGTAAVTDPTGSSTGSYHVIRGGDWGYYAWGCRSAVRNTNGPTYYSHFSSYLGFRIVCLP